ncbi:uncharacterized protein V1518DRAFT_418683 [Limtongia smithiae]|uniref:uncharacterized protein n=1 Tax=Limtongia smithiae TaxID=1125753 RepID=UPI0034CF619C
MSEPAAQSAAAAPVSAPFHARSSSIPDALALPIGQAAQPQPAALASAPHPSKSKLDLEPNPFEQSFASKEPSPSAQKPVLPSVATLASPSILSSGSTAGFWGINSLRSGPLSPALLQGPQMAFADSHLRSGLTPNESGIRTGLTPGGSGSIFPSPSPTASMFGLMPPVTPSGLQPTSFPQTPQPIEPAPSQSHHVPASVPSAPPPPPPPSVSVTSAPPAVVTAAATGSGGSAFRMQITNPVPAPPRSKPETFAADSASVAANGLFLLSQGQQAEVSSKAGALQADKQQADAPQRLEPKNDKKRSSSARSKSGGRKGDDAPASSSKKQKTTSALSPSIGAASTAGDLSGPDNEDDMDDDPSMDTKKMTDEEKRKNFLERNRVAALKCRQRKKQWLQNLQARVEYYTNENDVLSQQVTALREEVVNLKAMLLAHKDCSVSRGLSSPGQDPIGIALAQNYVGMQNAQSAAGASIGNGMVNPNLAASRRYV